MRMVATAQRAGLPNITRRCEHEIPPMVNERNELSTPAREQPGSICQIKEVFRAPSLGQRPIPREATLRQPTKVLAMKVLVIADAPWVRNEVAAAASSSGFELVEEADPRSAVDACAKYEPDIVIVDLQVGSMGGMAITRSLRDAIFSGEIEDTTLVLLLDRQADTFLAGRSGADAWLVKPFTTQHLRALLTPVAAKG
ncbi:MAG TPA: response regulator [Actinobacteria bacterium]|nr:response regulator [Actinomycetota bacterium]